MGPQGGAGGVPPYEMVLSAERLAGFFEEEVVLEAWNSNFKHATRKNDPQKKFAYLKQLRADQFPWQREELERLSKAVNLPGFWRKLVTEYVDSFVNKTQPGLTPEQAEFVGRYGRLVRAKHDL